MNTKLDQTAPMIALPGLRLNPHLQLVQPVDGQEAWEARDPEAPGEVRVVRFVSVEEALARPAWVSWRAQFDPTVVPTIADVGDCGSHHYVVQPFERIPSLAQVLAQGGASLPLGSLRALFEAIARFYVTIERRHRDENAMGLLRPRGVLVRRLSGPKPEFLLPEFGMPLGRERVVPQLRALARDMFAGPGGAPGARAGVPANTWALTDAKCTRGDQSVAAFLTAWNASWRTNDDEEMTTPLLRRKAPSSIVTPPLPSVEEETWRKPRRGATPPGDKAVSTWQERTWSADAVQAGETQEGGGEARGLAEPPRRRWRTRFLRALRAFVRALKDV